MSLDDRSAKNIATLVGPAQLAAIKFLAACNAALKEEAVIVKIISGTRTYAEQNALYAQGRTKPGRIVTKARAGYSNHNFGVAWDIGLFKGTAYLGESPLYDVCGRIGREQGLAWGGDWKSFKDKPHFELKTGLTLAQMRARVAKGERIA